MEIWAAKLTSLVVILTTTLIFGLIPIKVIKIFRASQVSITGPSRSRLKFGLSVLNCFAGGVFLGTTLLHLIPEVREDCDALLKGWGIETDFAVAEFVISVGFFIIMLLETLVMVLQHHNSDIPFDSVESSVECDTRCCSQSRANKASERMPFSDERKTTQMGYGSMGTTADIRRESDQRLQEPQLISDARTTESDHHEGHPPHPHHRHHHHHHKHHPVTVDTEADAHQHHCGHPPVVVETGACVHVIHPSHHQHHHVEASQLSSLRSFVLLLALSLHTVFEGLAIGLQPNEASVWNLFVAIVVHKSIIAFSIGIQFAESLSTYGRAILFVVLFALMSPIGIALGLSLTVVDAGNSGLTVASSALKAIATGTFLHVTFFEVLQKEVGQDHSIIKVLFVVLGYGTMVLLNLFNGEPHEGG